MNLPPLILELSIEQQFELVKLENDILRLSESQAKQLLLETTRLIMLKDNLIKQLVKK